MNNEMKNLPYPYEKIGMKKIYDIHQMYHIVDVVKSNMSRYNEDSTKKKLIKYVKW